ncbi:MAG: hypothetical protein CM1200mP40_03460 [Gammaproteobacteria bacterium]|nr:MAG: hypothetical protein CM1200mP40_03460 [Gammaproteobacteria bacterium]
MGHSLGGGASLRAAEELGDAIKGVFPLTPYCCELGQSFEGDLNGVTTPTLIIATADDRLPHQIPMHACSMIPLMLQLRRYTWNLPKADT